MAPAQGTCFCMTFLLCASTGIIRQGSTGAMIRATPGLAIDEDETALEVARMLPEQMFAFPRVVMYH